MDAGGSLRHSDRRMQTLLLFTDGSVDPARGLGVGVALGVPESWLDRDPRSFDAGQIASRCAFRRFEATSSTQLEIDCAIWALTEQAPASTDLVLLTDSQCVAGLLGRRARLENTGFVSGRSGGELRHAERFREFFHLHDRRPFRIMKLAGHTDFRYQNAAHRIFHFVDREARRQLKRWLRERPLTGEK